MSVAYATSELASTMALQVTKAKGAKNREYAGNACVVRTNIVRYDFKHTSS